MTVPIRMNLIVNLNPLNSVERTAKDAKRVRDLSSLALLFRELAEFTNVAGQGVTDYCD